MYEEYRSIRLTSGGMVCRLCGHEKENVLPKSYEAELVEDMISIMSSFSARIYGKRSAENARKKKEAKQQDAPHTTD